MRRLTNTFLFAVLVILATACGSSGGGQEVEITINLSEFAYNPETIELKVGQKVTLNLVNQGTLEHEIMFGRDVVFVDGVANGFDVDFFELAGIEPEGMMLMSMDEDMSMDSDHSDGDDHDEKDSGESMEGMDHDMDTNEVDEHAHSGYMTTVGAMGATTTITFTVTDDMVGEWEYGCFLQDGTHYTAGMHGTLIISK